MLNFNTDFFIKAIEHEFDMDKKVNIKKRRFFNIFRPMANRLTLKYVLFFISTFFIAIFAPFVSRCNKVRPCDEMSEDVFFIISDKSINIFQQEDPSSFFGRIDKPELKISYHDVKLYYKLLFLFIKKFKLNFWFYPSLLLLPEMISVYKILSNPRISSVSMTNQYDRWALFIGLISQENEIKLNIYQHGLLSSSFQPKYKIPKVQKLFCYNKEQLIIFNSKLIRHTVLYFIDPPKLSLNLKVDGVSVFLAGTSDASFFELELEILNRISTLKDVTLFFKPHPLNKVEKYKRLNKSVNKVIYLSENDGYPSVDYFIHSGSTLGLEYQNSSNSVLIINTFVVSDADKILNLIKESSFST